MTYTEVIQDGNGDKTDSASPDPVSEPVDGLRALVASVQNDWPSHYGSDEAKAWIAACDRLEGAIAAPAEERGMDEHSCSQCRRVATRKRTEAARQSGDPR